MEIKSKIIKEYIESQNIQLESKTGEIDITIDASLLQKRYYKEEIPKIEADIDTILENKFKKFELKNINLEESSNMDSIMQKIAKNTNIFKVSNSNIGNLDSYMGVISGKIGKNYSLSEKQYIKEIEYNKGNKSLVIAAQNLDVLSEINRYKMPKTLKIKLYNKDDVSYLVKYIDVIRNMKIGKIMLSDNSEDKINDILKYENYINEKIVLFQSELIKGSLGLDKLPTNKFNHTMYNINLDGGKINNSYIYILEGEEEKLFIKDMQEIVKYINIASISFKNVAIPNNYEIRNIINEAENKSLIKENEIIESDINNKRTVWQIIKEKLYALFNLKSIFGEKQKAFPIYKEESE